jgi:hypothetical protein
MALLAIFSAIGLIDSLLNLVVELDLLHSFALLQQLGDLHVFVLAEILSLHLEQETLIFINLTIFKFINGLLKLAISAEIATRRKRSAFARRLGDSLRLLDGQQLDMLQTTAPGSQVGEASAVVLPTLEHGRLLLVRFEHFRRTFRLHRCLLLLNLLVKCRGSAACLAGVHRVVRFRGRVDSKREALLLHGRHEVGQLGRGPVEDLLLLGLRSLLDLKHDLKMISTRREEFK